MKRGIALVSVLALLALAAAVYLRVGWTRMETACTADPPGGTPYPWKRVSLGYSLSPLGFQCTYGNGRQRTSLWF